MSTSVMEVVESARQLTPAEKREVLARLWPEQAARNGQDVWVSVRFSDALRVVAYAPEQESYVNALRELLRQGALARLESEADGTYEVYGPDRTYYVTMTTAREFAALLSSWPPDQPHVKFRCLMNRHEPTGPSRSTAIAQLFAQSDRRY